MADSQISHKTRRAILQDVLRDNLTEGSARRPEPATPKKGGSGSGWRGALLLLPLLLGISGYLFAFSSATPLSPVSQEITRTVYTGKIPEPEPEPDSRPTLFTDDPLPLIQRDDHLPRNFIALASGSEMPLAELFGLGIRTIVIDPGHGGRDPGAVGAGGLLEKEVTLDVARRLRDRLQKYPGYRILMTRDDDVFVSLRDRVHFANASQADLFISIHVNSIKSSVLNVIETYYFGAQAADEQALELAALENRGSEYLMAEFRGMIQKIGDTFKQQESQTLAAAIQENLYRHIRREGGRIENRGIKMAPFIVLLGADMPSVLAEITCISSLEEERKLADPNRREDFARYLEGGIVNYLNRSHSLEPDGGITTYAGEKTNGKG